MSAPPTEPGHATPRIAYGLMLGTLTGLAFAAIYGLSAELFGLTYGLPLVSLLGGWMIGTAVAWGAWGERAHAPDRGLRIGATVIAVLAGVLGLASAFVVSQVLLPRSATPLLERLSVTGLADYLGGTFDFVRVLHVAALLLLAVMAWRAAR